LETIGEIGGCGAGHEVAVGVVARRQLDDAGSYADIGEALCKPVRGVLASLVFILDRRQDKPSGPLDRKADGTEAESCNPSPSQRCGIGGRCSLQRKSSPNRLEEQVIDYRSLCFEAVAEPVDAVFDTVGRETLERSWSLLKAEGRMVTIVSGNTTDEESRTLSSSWSRVELS
jgi:hypothetical protein